MFNDVSTGMACNPWIADGIFKIECSGSGAIGNGSGGFGFRTTPGVPGSSTASQIVISADTDETGMPLACTVGTWNNATFLLIERNGTNWKCQDTGTAPQPDTCHITLVSTTAGTGTAYINQTAAGTANAYVPTAATRHRHFVVLTRRTAARRLVVDYFRSLGLGASQ